MLIELAKSEKMQLACSCVLDWTVLLLTKQHSGPSQGRVSISRPPNRPPNRTDDYLLMHKKRQGKETRSQLSGPGTIEHVSTCGWGLLSTV